MDNNFDHRINPNWFIDQLTFYQSANSSPEAIKRNFLIRIAEYEAITDQLRRKKYADPVQHELILGRRGSGKSTLLRRIQVEIDEDPGLSEKYIAINLAEEQAAIYRLSDLWFEVLEELMIRLDQRKKLKEFNSFDDNQAYTRYLYNEINQLLQAANKKAVLLLDNLDRILENFNDDANLFRETLLNHNDLAIIGGSTRMDEYFWDYRRPFYEFFRRHRLEGLTFGEIHQLLNHWAAEMQLPLLQDYALHNRGKVEAIRILTDGLPRALQFFIQILLHDSALYGFDYLRKVMDRATPLYQERLNNLTAAQRKIVQEMAFHWQAIPTKLLAERCRMESKLISSYLKQLDGFGIIETIPTGNKNHLYRISERFFNMWLIVTQGNPDQKRRAKYLTMFLESFYDGHELVELAKGHIEKLKSGEIGFDKAMVLSKGLAHSRFIGVFERDVIINLTKDLYPQNGLLAELPKTFSEIHQEAVTLIEDKKFKDAISKLDEVENESDGFRELLKGKCFAELNDASKAELSFQKAANKKNIWAMYELANIFLKHEKLTEALELYSLIISIINTRQPLGIISSNFEDFQIVMEDDEGYLSKELLNLKSKVLNYLGALSWYVKNESKAEQFFIESLNFGNIQANNSLANLYFETNQKPKDALNLIKSVKVENDSNFETSIIIEIWNGVISRTKEKIRQVILLVHDKECSRFLKRLLFLSQTHLLLSLFHDLELGKDLIAKYELLYYATLILAGETGDNLLLRIPPEVMPTVEQIVTEVREKQAFYAQPPKE